MRSGIYLGGLWVAGATKRVRATVASLPQPSASSTMSSKGRPVTGTAKTGMARRDVSLTRCWQSLSQTE
jgi:hypothetical protein